MYVCVFMHVCVYETDRDRERGKGVDVFNDCLHFYMHFKCVKHVTTLYITFFFSERAAAHTVKCLGLPPEPLTKLLFGDKSHS